MRWQYHIKYKIRAAVGLMCIILIILAGNFFLRQKISTLDQSMSSICNDRLKPSVYIFEITDNIYRKRLLIKENDINTPVISRIHEHNRLIATLIASYEKTILTTEETREWAEFRKHLDQYNELEGSYLTKNLSSDKNQIALESELNSVLYDLNRLSKIQIGEGDELRQQSKTIMNSSLTFSTLEMALLIILGLFTLAILSVSDRAIFNNAQKHSLN